jgi:RNA polymerase sigma factor (sigma-70 family)
MPPELARLLAADAACRDEAWSLFLAAFSAPMLRVARSLGGDHDAVMDRYAYVLDQLHSHECRKLRTYERPGAGDFVLWLVVVTRRLCLDHYRARYGRSRHQGGDGPPEESRRARRRLIDLVAERVDPADLADPAGNAPDELLVRSELAHKLQTALDALDSRDRLLVRLRFSESMSAREIGELMRFPTVFHVYRRLDLILRTLRDALLRAGLDRSSG